MINKDKIRHTKRLVDAHFSVLFEEVDDFTDEEVLDEIFAMADTLFSLAEEFGYREFIETEIYKYHKNKL